MQSGINMTARDVRMLTNGMIIFVPSSLGNVVPSVYSHNGIIPTERNNFT